MANNPNNIIKLMNMDIKKKENKKKNEIIKPQVEENINIINDRYSLLNTIGSGSFGEINLAYDSKEMIFVAMKFEVMNTKSPQLRHEYNVLQTLNNHKCSLKREGIPKVYLFDKHENKSNYFVMEFLGPSLADLFEYREMYFSLSTCLLLAIQMISRVEYLHDTGFIHRDIKPENILFGLYENSNILYLIDYGLSKEYKEQGTSSHNSYKENRNLVGTARYASLNSHLGIEQSRRDDLESIAYMLIYFYIGKLPWQMKNEKEIDINLIKNIKLITTTEMLCKDMPVEFCFFLNYIKNLKYQDKPDYTSLKGMFYSLLVLKTKTITYTDERDKKNKQIHYSQEGDDKLDYMTYDWFNPLINNEINEEIDENHNDIDENIKSNIENQIDIINNNTQVAEENLEKQVYSLLDDKNNYINLNKMTFEEKEVNLISKGEILMNKIINNSERMSISNNDSLSSSFDKKKLIQSKEKILNLYDKEKNNKESNKDIEYEDEFI